LDGYEALSPAAAGRGLNIQHDPGVPLRSTPGFILSPASQASRDIRLLRRLQEIFACFAGFKRYLPASQASRNIRLQVS